ncbi:MAG TPA: hypothetical protein PLF37_15870, partial [Planctomycetota bacterium]|nr:hypothetical protein [Planctomycetota bacterium]
GCRAARAAGPVGVVPVRGWPALSLENASMANWGYLTIVLFHGWLELAFLSYFAVSGARPAP